MYWRIMMLFYPVLKKLSFTRIWNYKHHWGTMMLRFSWEVMIMLLTEPWIFFWTGLCWILMSPRCSNQPKLLACKFLALTFPWCLMFRRSKTAVWFYLILFSGRSTPLNYKWSTVVLNPKFLFIFTTFTFLIVDSRQKAESYSWWVTEYSKALTPKLFNNKLLLTKQAKAVKVISACELHEKQHTVMKIKLPVAISCTIWCFFFFKGMVATICFYITISLHHFTFHITTNFPHLLHRKC